MNGGRRNGRILVYVDVDVSQRCHVLHKLSSGFLLLLLLLSHLLLPLFFLLLYIDMQSLFR